MQDQPRPPDPATTTNDQAELPSLGQPGCLGKHRGRSGRQAAATPAAASGHDRAAGPSAHAQPESVLLRPAAVVRLKGALAHGLTPDDDQGTMVRSRVPVNRGEPPPEWGTPSAGEYALGTRQSSAATRPLDTAGNHTRLHQATESSRHHVTGVRWAPPPKPGTVARSGHSWNGPR